MNFLDAMLQRSNEVATLNRASTGFAGCALLILPTGFAEGVQYADTSAII